MVIEITPRWVNQWDDLIQFDVDKDDIYKIKIKILSYDLNVKTFFFVCGSDRGTDHARFWLYSPIYNWI